MKQTSCLLGWGIVFLSLMMLGCAKKPDSTVTSSDGIRISFDQQGSGSPTLVFIHGWGNDRSVWKDQFAHFSERYSVVNLDLPGFGRSGKSRQNSTIGSFGEDVATVIRKLDLKQVILIGFSMGNNVAVETANRIPELVAGLVVTEGLYDVERKTPTSAISDIVSFYMDIVANPTNEKLVSNGFYKNDPEMSFQRVLEMLPDTPVTGWRESLLDSIRWGNEDRIESVSQLRAPVIAINSERWPTKIEVAKKYIPSFQAMIIPNTGHLVMWDAPEEFNRLLEESIQELTRIAN